MHYTPGLHPWGINHLRQTYGQTESGGQEEREEEEDQQQNFKFLLTTWIIKNMTTEFSVGNS